MDIDLSSVPALFKPVLPYLRRGVELERKAVFDEETGGDLNIVAILCYQYAVTKCDGDGLSVQVANLADTSFLADLRLAAQRPVPVSEAEALEVLNRFSNEIFSIADAEDMAGQATKETARNLYSARIFFDVFALFNADSVELNLCKKYAQTRAEAILGALQRNEQLPPEQGWQHFKNEATEAASSAVPPPPHLFNQLVQEKQSDVHSVYEIEPGEPIGRGAYGVVQIVTHRQSRRKYAMKTLQLNRLEDTEWANLRNEITIMRAVDHPNIIRLFETYMTETDSFQCQYFLIMEMCTGGELYNRLSQEGQCTEQQVAKYATQMLSAVRWCHENGIVHRDLKLQNFLLENDTADAPLKLIDFGLSKYFGEDQDMLVMHRLVGSIHYIAPEVIGQRGYNEKCDIWSIGVIVYTLLAGCHPFNGQSEKEIILAIRSGEVHFPPERFANVSPQAVDFLRSLLVQEADARPSAAQALQGGWLQLMEEARRAATAPTPLKREIWHCLRQYRHFRALKKMVCQVVAHNLGPSQIAGLRDAFVELDKDHSGTISLKDMEEALARSSHWSATDKNALKLKEVFSKVDTTGSGVIQYNEFIAATMWERVMIDDEALQKAFDVLRAGDEVLTIESIRKAVGSDFSEERWAEVEETLMAHRRHKQAVNARLAGGVGLVTEGGINFDDFKLLITEHCEDYRNTMDTLARASMESRGSLTSCLAYGRQSDLRQSLLQQQHHRQVSRDRFSEQRLSKGQLQQQMQQFVSSNQQQAGHAAQQEQEMQQQHMHLQQMRQQQEQTHDGSRQSSGTKSSSLARMHSIKGSLVSGVNTILSKAPSFRFPRRSSQESCGMRDTECSRNSLAGGGLQDMNNFRFSRGSLADGMGLEDVRDGSYGGGWGHGRESSIGSMRESIGAWSGTGLRRSNMRGTDTIIKGMDEEYDLVDTHCIASNLVGESERRSEELNLGDGRHEEAFAGGGRSDSWLHASAPAALAGSHTTSEVGPRPSFFVGDVPTAQVDGINLMQFVVPEYRRSGSCPSSDETPRARAKPEQGLISATEGLTMNSMPSTQAMVSSSAPGPNNLANGDGDTDMELS
jgi:calcium-dependent protein kinase